MITDALLRVSNAQSIVGTGNIVSTDTIDLGIASDAGAGEELNAHWTIGTAVAGATSVEFQIITADDVPQTVNVTPVASTGPIPIASLTAGRRLTTRLNPAALLGTLGRRYLGARYVIVGTSTTGTVTCDFVKDIQDQKNYASGFAVT